MVHRLTQIIIGCFLVLPLIGCAQEANDTFVISVFGGVDDEAPTTPTLLTAEPVTPTQINLSWSSSTDNYIVSGYTVSRDAVVIATTTQLTYVDSGLTPTTTYSYSVRAFDTFFNYSSSSNSIATTTPAVPVLPPPTVLPVPTTTRTEGTAVRAVADAVSISTDTNSVTFDVLMARPSNLQLRWGRTGSYELGYVVSDVFVREHQIPLTDLSPRTTYEYELIGFTPYGPGTVLQQGTFTTEGVLLQFLPENVSRFRAVATGADVDLSWALPAASDDVAYVRVLRSHLGFPAHLQDGAVVYQGSDQSVRMTDEGVLNQYSPVYYTAFVVDTQGQVSSGAVALVFAETAGGGMEPIDGSTSGYGQYPVPGSTGQTIVPAATSSVNQERVEDTTRLPELTDITITQGELEGDRSYTLADQDVRLATDQSFVISIPKKLVSNNLKSIIATVVDPTDTRQGYSFLLRLNQAGDAYETTVPALFVAGKSQVTVEVYDFESYVVSSYLAPITLTLELNTEGVGSPSDLLFLNLAYVFGGALLLFLLALIFWWRKQTEDNA